ncbi:M15 family metallopeptidase [Nodularia sp. NIES-3585]|uniref:M15 family metallopeptidase n=1 Tax=Nodularia sp. NIES-3585 TaxID=1973477 RepID=UPI0020CD5C05|nr:M15 family metallopeptidase [Nodularia sp. NIES-3585]
MFLIGVFLNLYAFTLFIKPKSPISQTSYKVERELTVNPSSVTDISPKVTLSKKINQLESNKTKLGHFLYAEGDFSQMLIVASYAPHEYQRFERLAPEAALALMKLIYAARNEGVWIIPVSGFRSVAAQEKLFQKQIEKQGSPEKAAKLSAPPGYSEHATGYAIDLADGNFPKQDITNQFAETKAFQWLTLHAKEFGFEMSFPKNNPQGVSYEPWHWRYIGSSHAAAIFTNAKNSRF